LLSRSNTCDATVSLKFTTSSYKTCSCTLKASRISSSESVSFIFLAIIVRNSGARRSAFEVGPSPKEVWRRTRKVDCAVIVGVDFVDHVLQLRLGRILTQRPHHGAQLLGCDLALTQSVCAASLSTLFGSRRPRPTAVARKPEDARVARRGMRSHRERQLTIAVLVLIRSQQSRTMSSRAGAASREPRPRIGDLQTARTLP